MRRIFSSIAVFIIALSTASAEEIQSKDQLMSFLRSQLPEKQQVAYTYRTGDTFAAQHRFGNCLSAKTFSRIDLITRILHAKGLIDVEVTKETGGFIPLGMGHQCEYRITGFSGVNYSKYRIETAKENDQISSITVPLVKQTLLGVDEVNLNGGMSINGTRCDISFRPWFKNESPSVFVILFRRAIQKDLHYDTLFKDEYRTSTWCLQREYDDSIEWKRWSRF